jgi:Arc/MetJ-type ribon-helix-helix transcriptional regulator
MPEEWTVRLPDDVSNELSELPENRVNTVVSDALREVLDLAESAEDRREDLRESMGLSGRDSEELDENKSEAERKQTDLREQITGGR